LDVPVNVSVNGAHPFKALVVNETTGSGFTFTVKIAVAFGTEHPSLIATAYVFVTAVNGALPTTVTVLTFPDAGVQL
jgi:hypothetical protein